MMEEPFAANMKAGGSLENAPIKAYDQLRSMVWKKSGHTSYQRLFRTVSSSNKTKHNNNCSNKSYLRYLY